MCRSPTALIRHVTSTLAVAVLVAAGCGGDEETSGETEVASKSPRLSGVVPSPPAMAIRCLERDGFDVTSTGSAGPDVSELLVIAVDGGDGTINYYEHEQNAFDAEVASLAAQEPHSVAGRVGTALYAFELDRGAENAARRIAACL